MDNWKKTLGNLFSRREEERALEREKAQLEGQRHIDIKKDISEFISTVVKPAFEELKTELEKYGRRVRILNDDKDGLFSTTIIVQSEASTPAGFKYIEEFTYRIISNLDTEVWIDFKYTENKIIKEEARDSYINNQEDSNIYNISKEDIIDSFMSGYERFI